jgi:putative transcriptional regulator
MIKYKIDVLQALKNAGFTTYRLRKDKILGEATIQKLRNFELVSWENVNTICRLLSCQPGDILKYVKDE